MKEDITKNKIFYGALAKKKVNGEMVSPVSFCPVTEEFIGRGGNFENPYYVVKNQPFPYKAGRMVTETVADGYEKAGSGYVIANKKSLKVLTVY